MPPSKLDTLIQKHKSYAARIVELWELANASMTDDSRKDIFEVCGDAIEKNHDAFYLLHNEVIGQMESDESFTQLDAERKKVDQYYYFSKSMYKKLFSTASPPDSGNQIPSTATQFPHKLPKLQIKAFSGSLKEWTSFFELYNCLIHNNDSLSDVEKFNYLMTLVTGEPLNLIKSIPLISSNYITAYNLLKGRYHNKRQLASFHYDEIYHAPTLTRSNPTELRRLLDVFGQNLAALENLNFNVKEWDYLLFQCLLNKLDSKTRTDFELKHVDYELPTYDQLNDFLDGYCKAYESLPANRIPQKSKTSHFDDCKKATPFKKTVFVATGEVADRRCPLCSSSHLIYQCPMFLSKSISDRYTFIKEHKGCTNCLSLTHSFKACKSKSVCRFCRAFHHTLLHRPRESQNNSAETIHPIIPEPPTDVPNSSPAQQTATSCTSAISAQESTILLSTVQLEVQDIKGNYQVVRALLDTGSMSNFISSSCLKRLGLRAKRMSIPIECLNDTALPNTEGIVNCTIKPLNQSTPIFDLEAIVLPKICSSQPKVSFDIAHWAHVRHLKLADAKCHVPGPIDMLLGAELLPYIFSSNKIFGKASEPVALETIYGWVLQGRASCKSPSYNTALFTGHSSITASLDQCLRKFWEIENIASVPVSSPDDIQCEEIFTNTTKRDTDGRFSVTLPFRHEPPHFGETYSRTLRRFNQLERRLSLRPQLKEEYSEFMKDYLDSGHMSLIPHDQHDDNNAYFIPHHCIIKPDSRSTRLRVVFDASAKTSFGNSLNDELLTGPKLQQDIFSILINFRKFPIGFTCDIRKMYRQIWLADEHRNYQRILWRFSPSEPIQQYRLNTVTYGISSSPYLALRTLLELARLERHRFPYAASIIEKHIYVDDVVVGAENIESALDIRDQLVGIFASAGFELRKWASNSTALLKNLHAEAQTPISFDNEEPCFMKVLGLRWDPIRDIFSYAFNPIDHPCTKRTILSDISRIYDPLGFLAPIVLKAKHLIQKLWLSKTDWDEAPSPIICETWQHLKEELPLLMLLEIPRYQLSQDINRLEIHGFADASEVAYAASVYFRVEHKSGAITSLLCCAKSRVSPLKTLSMPRLELLGAVLLTDLIAKILETSSYKVYRIVAWTDSQVVLSWIHSHPHRWKVFVANRVSHIHDILPAKHWHHVPTSDNPADCASRGCFPSQLRNHVLWWHGPSWLTKPSSFWPTQASDNLESAPVIAEARICVNLAVDEDSHPLLGLLQRFSSLQKIIKITMYILRFIQRTKTTQPSLTLLELSNVNSKNALLVLTKSVQIVKFSDVVDRLHKRQPIPKPFRKLGLFLDEKQLIRVGGRLKHSQLEFEVKHPLLLPSNHPLTDLVIRDTHERHLHPGYNTLLYLLLQQFWILSPRRAISRCLSNCQRCFRVNPRTIQPPMADLPSYRVTQLRPFTAVCLDYAGPFFITLTKSRGVKTTKSYVCLFVCCAVKAVHLELVSDLSSETFLAAFQRFIARRGSCIAIHSDQGTNFVGANHLLHKLAKETSSKLNMSWHFNPPSAPHFNGLAEAGVKSVKSHLKRVMGDQILTYEEFYTLLARVEATLNSRPLCAISSDPNDLQPLTPGHFLVLEPLNSAVPDLDLSDVAINRLNRWQLIQKLYCHFWKRWHLEYLHTLQQRAKWHKPVPNVEVGTLVLVKHDNKPPNQWDLARITHLHPGKDGIARVVTIKGTHGSYQRPIIKLCPLPNQ